MSYRSLGSRPRMLTHGFSPHIRLDEDHLGCPPASSEQKRAHKNAPRMFCPENCPPTWRSKRSRGSESTACRMRQSNASAQLTQGLVARRLGWLLATRISCTLHEARFSSLLLMEPSPTMYIELWQHHLKHPTEATKAMPKADVVVQGPVPKSQAQA